MYLCIFHLQDKEFRLCLQYWLGLRMSEDGATCPVCQGAADAYGDHQVGCGGNGDRIHRHDSIRDAVYSAAQSAALAPRKEAPSVILGSSSRPADVYLPNWKRGQPAALDIHVISTMQQQTLVGASTTPGHALRVGEERKMAAHAGPCRAAGVTFIPLVVESLGGWSEEAIYIIKSIGRLQGATTWDSSTRNNPPPFSTTIHLPVEGECLPVGQTAACPLGHSGRHCLTCLTLILVFSSVCAFFRFFIKKMYLSGVRVPCTRYR